MDKYDYIRQFISNFLHGKPNAEGLIQSIGDEIEKLNELSIAVTDQLTISTASQHYLDKQLSALGITRPAELGMDDLAFRNMGIQINQSKQLVESIHTVLSTFYGDEVTRASVISTKPEPYYFEPGDELIFKLESDEEYILVLQETDFLNIQQATAKEVADVFTRFVRLRGLNSYAQEYINPDTQQKHVRLFGNAKGPFSMIQILGGRMQVELEFPTIRPTNLPLNNTVWEITRTTGNTHRFRWVSGSRPLLEKIMVGDKALIYGAGFENVGINGTFTVTNMRPAQTGPTLDSGWFEIEIENFTVLKTTPPDQNPPPNTPTNTYSFTVAQTSYDDLKFFLSIKNLPYMQPRYALAWEPASNLLKIYMPATTKVVRRDLEGSAHVHAKYPFGTFDGTFGSSTDIDKKIEILGSYSFRFKTKGLDCIGSGGTITYNPGPVIKDIDYIYRENGYTYVFTKQEHNLPALPPDQWGRVFTNTLVTIQVLNQSVDDTMFDFLGPYVIDPAANYSLTDTICFTKEVINQNDSKRSLNVIGKLPDKEGFILFDLNKDTEEGPVKYFSVQPASNVNVSNIISISQNGSVVTVLTATPHNALPNATVTISGTVNFNGTYTIDTTPSDTVFTFTKTPPNIVSENTGLATVQLTGESSTIILDSTYTFKYKHEIGSDVTLLSDSKAYIPIPNGKDYGFYITGTADGREFAKKIIEEITALGIKLEIVIVYPNDIGLGNYGKSETIPPVSEKVYVWGK